MTWTVRYINNQLMRFPAEYEGIADNYVLQADGTWVANAGGGGGASALDDLSDVALSTSIDEGSLLIYDTGSSQWVDGYASVTIDAVNETGDEILKGKPVYVSGTHTTSGKASIQLADSDGSGTYPAIGLAAANIGASGGEGRVIVSGMLHGVDTTGYSAGDALYLDSASGGLTATRPDPSTGPTDQVQKVGLVTRVHSTAGDILVIGAGRVNDVNNELIALTGVSRLDTDLGTFTGTTIADNETVKGALQDLETAVETSDILQRENGHPIRTISSTTLTDLLSYQIVGGTMAVGDSITFSVRGELTQNSGGGSQNIRIQTRCGGATLTESSSSFSDDTDPYGFEITGEYVYTDDTSFDKQFILMNFRAGLAQFSSSGYGNIGGIAKDGLSQSTGGALTMSNNQTLEVRARFDTTATNCSINVYSTEVRINRKP